jgi:O-antigen/teichoic acid export membrane protein
MTTDPAGPSKIGRSIAAGAAWMVGLRTLDRLVGVISMTILARILVPGDFGLVSLAMTTAAFLEMFGQTQIDVALIRDRQADRSLYDSAWTMDILRGVVLALILVAVANPVASFFSEARVAPVLYAVAAIQIVGSFENVGVVDFRKDMRFGREFRYRLTSRAVGATLTVALAILWRSHWALVAGIGLQSACRVGLSYAMSPYRPKPALSRIGEIFGFSKWIIAQNLFLGLKDQAPVFLIGKLVNVEVLGFFNLAKEISAFVTTELRAPIRRALYPGFARMSMETGELRTGFLASFAVMLVLSLPLAVGLYLLAPAVVEILFGPRWAPAVPLLEILAINGIVQSFGPSSHLVYNRIGRPRLTAILNGTYLLLFLPSLVWGASRYGAAGAAWAIVATSGLIIFADFAIMCRLLAIDFRLLLGHVWRPVLAAACMGVVLAVLEASLGAPAGGMHALAMLAILTVVGALVYGGTLLVAWRASGGAPGAERHILRALEGIFAALAAWRIVIGAERAYRSARRGGP